MTFRRIAQLLVLVGGALAPIFADIGIEIDREAFYTAAGATGFSILAAGWLNRVLNFEDDAAWVAAFFISVLWVGVLVVLGVFADFGIFAGPEGDAHAGVSAIIQVSAVIIVSANGLMKYDWVRLIMLLLGARQPSVGQTFARKDRMGAVKQLVFSQ